MACNCKKKSKESIESVIERLEKLIKDKIQEQLQKK